ncbi:hypothetical protein, partial [Elizabethkingia meningoseptica]|uniref:hypothetical protein n=1 Tax=Elizabethkingia meningoseptica TaxID=238 RepID=UPI001F16769D
ICGFSISEDSYNKFKRTLCILLVDLFISGLLVEVVDKKNFVIFLYPYHVNRDYYYYYYYEWYLIIRS